MHAIKLDIFSSLYTVAASNQINEWKCEYTYITWFLCVKYQKTIFMGIIKSIVYKNFNNMKNSEYTQNCFYFAFKREIVTQEKK